jgi:hypothetical protein
MSAPNATVGGHRYSGVAREIALTLLGDVSRTLFRSSAMLRDVPQHGARHARLTRFRDAPSGTRVALAMHSEVAAI